MKSRSARPFDPRGLTTGIGLGVVHLGALCALIPGTFSWSAVVVMLVHTYYGFTAHGGPAGVGEAVGRAVRTSLVSAVAVTLFVSLAIYGQSGNFNLSG